MTIVVRIQGQDHPKSGVIDVRVTAAGAVVTAPFAYDDTKFVELAEDNTAYNFYKPKAGLQFVITGIRAKADRDVSQTADADVVVFEAAAIDSTTADKVLHQEAMVRGESVTLIPLNILVNSGKFLNAKTSDDDIHMTIMGYYIPEISPA